MKFGHLWAAGLTLAGAVGLARADPAPPGPRELHAADCVAALQVQTEALAAGVKAGDEAQQPLLLSRLEAGTAFVGDTYLHDDRDEKRARGLANKALENQKSLSDAQRVKLQDACAAEGTQLLTKANALERTVVKRLARKRMDRLLGR